MNQASAGALTGKVALVTGGAQGLGRAFAHRLAAGGAKVVVADMQAEKAERVAADIGAESAGSIGVDVTEVADVRAMVDYTLERFGAVHVLINNAAIFSTIRMQPFEQIAVDEFRRVVDVNLVGPFLCAQAVSPPMREQQSGRIINISSSTVLLGRENYAHYVSSKAGVVGLTRALARELGPAGVTVNAIMPGATETEINRQTVSREQAAIIVGRQAVPRRARPEDVVGAVAFLASDESALMTGQTLVVDGGISFI